MYLIELYKATNNTKYIQKSYEILLPIILEIDTFFNSDSVAFYTGRMSIAFTSARLYEVTNDEFLKEKIIEEVSYVEKKTTKNNDLVNGKAGILIALMHIHSIIDEDLILETINKYTLSIISDVKIGNQGLYWDRSGNNIKGLCGMSHGSSGIAYTFIELGNYFNNNTFYWLAKQAFNYEKEYYNKDTNNWLDLRKEFNPINDELAFKNAYLSRNIDFFQKSNFKDSNAWCHGAVGIGIARLRAFEVRGSLEYLQQARLAIQKTVQTNIYNKSHDQFILCHGQCGNAELFIEAYRILANVQYLQYAKKIAAIGIAKRKEMGHYSALDHHSIENNGLMIGTAGIGLFFLRLFRPISTFSVLSPYIRNSAYYQRRNKFKFLTFDETDLKVNIYKKFFERTNNILIDNNISLKSYVAAISKMSYLSVYNTVETMCNELEGSSDEGRCQKSIVELELMTFKLENSIPSDAYLSFKEFYKEKDISEISTYNEDQILDIKLRLDYDLVFVDIKGDWYKQASRSRNQTTSDYENLILYPTLEGVKEIVLTRFVNELLYVFKYPKLVREGIEEILDMLPSDTENIVFSKALSQIKELFFSGILVSATSDTDYSNEQ